MSRQLVAVLVVAGGLLLIAPLAHGTTLYVANNGVDGPSCGTKTSPCRSIGQTIANAVAGDAIVVGPGRYGDLNGNGVLGELGEENPDVFSPGCGCVLGVNKTLTLTSSNGAAATVIDATSVASIQNVLIIGNGVQFGKAGKGFTVTSTAAGRDPIPAVLDVVVRPSPTVPAGIVVDASNVAVTGNQVVFQIVDALVDISADQSFTITDISTFGSGSGIYAVENDGETVTIQGNQVIGGWEFGIRALSSGKTVKGNTVSLNLQGVAVSGKSSVEGNVIAGNFSTGIVFKGSATVIGNDVHGNAFGGLAIDTPPFSGSIARNNIFGNGARGNTTNCGLTNFAVTGVLAANNYWGAPTGPGVDPADDVCNSSGGTTTVTPFATKPFTVKAPIKP